MIQTLKLNYKDILKSEYFQSFLIHLVIFIVIIVMTRTETASIFNTSDIRIIDATQIDTVQRQAQRESHSEAPAEPRRKKARSDTREIRERTARDAAFTEDVKSYRDGEALPKHLQRGTALPAEKTLQDTSDSRSLDDSRETATETRTTAPAVKTSTLAGSPVKWDQSSDARKLTYSPKLEIPSKYKGKGVRGSILFNITVNGEGRVTVLKVLLGSSYGAELDQAIASQIRSYRFEASPSGQTSTGKFKVKFDLSN